jgi:hypothetical protein
MLSPPLYTRRPLLNECQCTLSVHIRRSGSIVPFSAPNNCWNHSPSITAVAAAIYSAYNMQRIRKIRSLESMEHGTLHANRYIRVARRVRIVPTELHDFVIWIRAYAGLRSCPLGMNTERVVTGLLRMHVCAFSMACIAPRRGRSSGMWWSLEQIPAQAPDG